MDRNTVIAIVLSAIVIIAATTIQAVFFTPEIDQSAIEAQQTVETVENTAISSSTGASEAYGVLFEETGTEPALDKFHIENDVVDITFNPEGAVVDSVRLKEHKTDGQPSEFIFKDEDSVGAFMLYAGNDRTNPIDAAFNYNVKELSVEDGKITQVTFYRDFIDLETGKTFTISKIFAIPQNDEYMIQLVVDIETSDGSAIPLSFNGYSYNLSFGPQVGPEFENLSSNYDYRRVGILRNDKGGKTNVKYDKNGVYTYIPEEEDEYLDWMSLGGKYFVAIAIPETDGIIGEYSATNVTKDEGVSQENYIYLTRKATSSSSVKDVYSYYLGPQSSSDLVKYDRAQDNIFGLSEHRLKKASDTSWLGWLETILKWCLTLIYKVIPNYGVAIIIMTIVIKLILHPLTKRSMESTAKMGALQPKINEIKEKFPDDPQAQNMAMAKLYKEENIKPMSSCWPMLIQFPILIAFYGLLNNNIDLRGAMFIPGWITDLSIPETIYTLPFNIPFLGNKIHLLPILYTISMIFSMKITQQGTSAAAGQTGMMNFMTYGMPIIFFFILYNAPSGLLVYWSVMNVISIGTQIYVNKKKGSQFKLEEAKKEADRIASKKKKRR